MGYAAYRVLVDLFPSQVAVFNALMSHLGYDPTNLTINSNTPAGVGNLSAAALLSDRHQAEAIYPKRLFWRICEPPGWSVQI
jgi:hypothetical protein